MWFPYQFILDDIACSGIILWINEIHQHQARQTTLLQSHLIFIWYWQKATEEELLPMFQISINCMWFAKENSPADWCFLSQIVPSPKRCDVRKYGPISRSLHKGSLAQNKICFATSEINTTMLGSWVSQHWWSQLSKDNYIRPQVPKRPVCVPQSVFGQRRCLPKQLKWCKLFLVSFRCRKSKAIRQAWPWMCGFRLLVWWVFQKPGLYTSWKHDVLNVGKMNLLSVQIMQRKATYRHVDLREKFFLKTSRETKSDRCMSVPQSKMESVGFLCGMSVSFVFQRT